MIAQTAQMALEAVWGSKMRSFLTMLGGSHDTVRIEDGQSQPLSLKDLDAIMAESLGSAVPLGHWGKNAGNEGYKESAGPGQQGDSVRH